MAETNTTYVYIHLGGEFIPAGRLTLIEEGRGGHARFQYGNHYLKRPDRVEIDPIVLRFPVGQNIEYQTADGFVLFGAIRDAAPDGWGRHVLDRAAGGVPLSEFAYLTAAGPDRIGALAFGPDMSGPRRITPWPEESSMEGEVLDLPGLLEASDQLATTDELAPRLRTFVVRGSSLGGAGVCVCAAQPEDLCRHPRPGGLAARAAVQRGGEAGRGGVHRRHDLRQGLLGAGLLGVTMNVLAGGGLGGALAHGDL